jgi:hypothetical protein
VDRDFEDSMSAVSSVDQLLKTAKVNVDPGHYFIVGLRHEEWARLLENPELSPRGSEPFMVLRDRHETTLLLDETDWQTLRHAARDARVDGDFRLLTFDIELEWKVVGFLARVTGVLADAGIPVGALSAFSRDHLLIKQEHVGRAMSVLARYVEELC